MVYKNEAIHGKKAQGKLIITSQVIVAEDNSPNLR